MSSNIASTSTAEDKPSADIITSPTGSDPKSDRAAESSSESEGEGEGDAVEPPSEGEPLEEELVDGDESIVDDDSYCESAEELEEDNSEDEVEEAPPLILSKHNNPAHWHKEAKRKLLLLKNLPDNEIRAYEADFDIAQKDGNYDTLESRFKTILLDATVLDEKLRKQKEARHNELLTKGMAIGHGEGYRDIACVRIGDDWD